MQDSDLPIKFPIPWANGAGGSFIRPIPQASQIGIENGAASLTDGFPPNCFIPISGGGSWPWGQDANGILKQMTQWLRWAQAGGPITYDASFQTSIGGYPKGAIVQSAVTLGMLWLCLVDNNVTNPDTGGAGWQVLVNLNRNVAVWKVVAGVQYVSVNGAAFTSTGATSFVPPYSTVAELEMIGGGGGSGGAAGTGASGGAAAGTFAQARVPIIAGTPIAVSVGLGGAAPPAPTTDGGPGGASTFGAISCPGGLGSTHATTGTNTAGGNTGGLATGSGVYFQTQGTPGGAGGNISSTITPGQGAATRYGGGNYANTTPFSDNFGAGGEIGRAHV